MLAIIYSDNNRGAIQFRDRRKQIVDFSEVRFGNITPTDCDGIIEYHNKAYILFEIKYHDATVPKGQLLALTRAVDDFKKANKQALLVIAEHDVDNTDEDIKADKCSVRKWYNGQWKTFSGSLKSLIEKFIAFVDRSD